MPYEEYYNLEGGAEEFEYILSLLMLSIERSLWAQEVLSQSAGETTKHEYDDKGCSSPECKCY